MIRGDVPRRFSSSLFVGIDSLILQISPTFSELVLGTGYVFQNIVPPPSIAQHDSFSEYISPTFSELVHGARTRFIIESPYRQMDAVLAGTVSSLYYSPFGVIVHSVS